MLDNKSIIIISIFITRLDDSFKINIIKKRKKARYNIKQKVKLNYYLLKEVSIKVIGLTKIEIIIQKFNKKDKNQN